MMKVNDFDELFLSLIQISQSNSVLGKILNLTLEFI